MIIDTHAHYDDEAFDTDREDVYKRQEFNHFFRIPVPRPKKAFSENTNSHMMNTMIVIYVREHIY